MKKLDLYKIGLFGFFFLVLCIQCKSTNHTLELNKFHLEKKLLEKNQPSLNDIWSGLSFSAKSLEKLTGIPNNITDIEFISINISHAPDSIITGLRAKNRDGSEVFYFDTDNNEDLINETALKLSKKNIEQVDGEELLSVPLQFDELVKGKIVKREIMFEIYKKGKVLDYHIKNYWHSQIHLDNDTLNIAAVRIPPDYAIMFIDSDKDGIYNKYFDTRSERIALGGKFYKIKIDIPYEEIELLATTDQPVDVGYAAPLFSGKIWQSDRIFNLSEELGKVTVLFFSVVDCHGTSACMPSLKEVSTEFAQNDYVNFISVAQDSSEVIKYYNRFDFPFLSIIDNNIWHDYGVISTPNFFIIDKKGIIQQRGGSIESKLLSEKIKKLLNN